MSLFNSVPNWQSMKDQWRAVAPYAAPPLAAGLTVAPLYYGFVAKSEQQLGNPVPLLTLKKVDNDVAKRLGLPAARMSLGELALGGVKAVPKIGAIIGTQMIAQSVVEKLLLKRTTQGEQEKTNFGAVLASSAIVGFVSAPPLAVFNGGTIKMTALESLKGMTMKQTGAITAREMMFIVSLRISDPLGQMMRSRLGDNALVDYSSAFASGAIGSVFNHAADTALTVWQEEARLRKEEAERVKKGFVSKPLQKKPVVIQPRHLMRGAPVRAFTVGCFFMGYKFLKGILDPAK